MPFNIKDIFLEIIQYYYNRNYINNDYQNEQLYRNYNNIYKYTPTIIQFNLISKLHYEWVKNIPELNIINEIKKSLIWLNSQNLRKTIRKNNLFSKSIIENWACMYISRTSVEISVLLYNDLNHKKLIGNYPYYNICYKFIYPDKFDTQKEAYGTPTQLKYKREYKYFP